MWHNIIKAQNAPLKRFHSIDYNRFDVKYLDWNQIFRVADWFKLNMRLCFVVRQTIINTTPLLGTKPLWHWRKWNSGPTSKRDPQPRYRPTGKCPLYRYETAGQLLHSEFGSNQVGCSCAWKRSLSCETNTGATEEVPASNQSWRGCNHPTSNWPHQGHQIPYLIPRTTN